MFCAACEGSEARLEILPAGKQEVSTGRNLVLTCRAQVPNLELVRDLVWQDPRGQEVQQDSRSATLPVMPCPTTFK